MRGQARHLLVVRPDAANAAAGEILGRALIDTPEAGP